MSSEQPIYRLISSSGETMGYTYCYDEVIHIQRERNWQATYIEHPIENKPVYMWVLHVEEPEPSCCAIS